MRVRKIVRMNKNYLPYLKNKDLINSIIEKEIEEFRDGKKYICSITNDTKKYKDFVIHIDREKWDYLREFCKNDGNVTITMMMNLFIKENIELIKD